MSDHLSVATQSQRAATDTTTNASYMSIDLASRSHPSSASKALASSPIMQAQFAVIKQRAEVAMVAQVPKETPKMTRRESQAEYHSMARLYFGATITKTSPPPIEDDEDDPKQNPDEHKTNGSSHHAAHAIGEEAIANNPSVTIASVSPSPSSSSIASMIAIEWSPLSSTVTLTEETPAADQPAIQHHGADAEGADPHPKGWAWTPMDSISVAPASAIDNAAESPSSSESSSKLDDDDDDDAAALHATPVSSVQYVDNDDEDTKHEESRKKKSKPEDDDREDDQHSSHKRARTTDATASSSL